MRALFARVGVDYVQWRAVSRTLLRTDFRVPLAESGESYSLHTIRGLLMLALVHSVVGLASAFVVFLNRDAVLTGTIVLSYVAFVLATAVLMQHGATMLSAADYLVLAPRPVSSRTFLAIRLTNILFHALLITTFVALPPILTFAFAHGPSLARGLAAAAAVYAWAIALTLTLSAGYGSLLRFVGAARLARALGYMQLGVGLLMYGGVFLASRLLGLQLRTATMPDEPWPWIIPPAWYAGYLAIATGTASGATWARAVLSIAVLGVLLIALRGRLGMDYASRLAELLTSSEAATARPQHTPLFARRESRAVALLVFAHFRHDLRVRMGVLGIVPLLLLYVLLGNEGPMADPFLGPPTEPFDYLALAILLFPAILSQQLSSSECYRASWIYDVTPASRPRLVIALKNVAVAYFVVPFLLVAALVFTWRFGHAGHAFVHTITLGLISHIALQASVLLNPHLPFARPPEKMSGSASLFAWMMFVLIGGQLLIWLLPRLVYVSWPRVAIVSVSLIGLTALLNRAIVWRVGSTPN